MSSLKQESSAEIAARFVRRRQQVRDGRRRRREERQRAAGRAAAARLSRLPAAGPERTSARRIALDFAEPTLRLVHDVLLDAIHADVAFGDRGALLMIAEQMVAIALGDSPCDDPPLTDREPS